MIPCGSQTDFQAEISLSDQSLQQFRRCVQGLLVHDADVPPKSAAEFVYNAAEEFSRSGSHGFAKVAVRLREESIGDRWNAVLAGKRPLVLSEWIAPHVVGTLLDLLCGDGRVGEAIRSKGFEVTFCERPADYGCDRSSHAAGFIDFEEIGSYLPGAYDTVLLCTVLHHEDNPLDTLKVGARLARRRLIIVENCIEDEYGRDYHLLLDLFFNHCLNQTALRSPASHAKADYWAEAASQYGQVALVSRNENMPGIPLPHHLIVVDRISGAGC